MHIICDQNTLIRKPDNINLACQKVTVQTTVPEADPSVIFNSGVPEPGYSVPDAIRARPIEASPVAVSLLVLTSEPAMLTPY